MGEFPVLEASVEGGQVPKWVFAWLCGSHCCPLQESTSLSAWSCCWTKGRMNSRSVLFPPGWGLGILFAASSAPELSLALLHHDGLKSSSAFQLDSSRTPTPSQPLPLVGSPASSISDCPSAEHKDLLHRSYYSQAKGAPREQSPGPGFLPFTLLSSSRAGVGEHPLR